MTISLHPLVWTFDAASGPNGQNSLLRVRINRRAARGVAVLAQELAEHWAKRRWLGLPWLWSRRSEAARIAYDEALELQGHAVEIEVAVALLRKDRALVLHAEAHALTAPGTSYRRKRLFEGLDADDLRLMLDAHRGEAAGWLARHRTTLERVAARIGLA